MAERARRTKSWLVNGAVKDYLDRLGQDERRWGETIEALASVKAGRIVDGDQMMEWIASWGIRRSAPARKASAVIRKTVKDYRRTLRRLA